MDRLKKIPTKGWVAIIIVVILAVVGINMWNNKKTNVLAKDSVVSMKFSGYQTQGKAKYNEDDLDLAILHAQVDKTKLPKSIKMQLFFNTKTGRDVTDNIEGMMHRSVPKNQNMLAQVQDWYKETKVRLDKEDSLSNGQKVVLSVSTSGDKKNPIKTASKTYKVSGLKKIKEIPTSDLLDKLDVNFYGYNGKGTVGISTSSSRSPLDGAELDINKNGKLSNGDKVKITIPDEYFEAENGEAYVGKHSFEKEVSGLTDLKSVTNFNNLKEAADKIMRDKYPYDADDPSSIAPHFEGLYVLPSDDVSKTIKINDDPQDANFKIVVLYLLPQSHDSVSDGDVSEITIDNPDISDNKIKIPEVDDLQPEISTKPTIKAAIDDYNQDGILLIKKSY